MGSFGRRETNLRHLSHHSQEVKSPEVKKTQNNFSISKRTLLFKKAWVEWGRLKKNKIKNRCLSQLSQLPPGTRINDFYISYFFVFLCFILVCIFFWTIESTIKAVWSETLNLKNCFDKLNSIYRNVKELPIIELFQISISLFYFFPHCSHKQGKDSYPGPYQMLSGGVNVGRSCRWHPVSSPSLGLWCHSLAP